MKESYDEGLANHIGPESCGGGSNAMAEALTRENAGRVLSREILLKSRVPTPWDVAEGNIGRVVSARHVWTLRGRRPRARTETSCTGTGRSQNRPRNGSLRSTLGTPRGYGMYGSGKSDSLIVPKKPRTKVPVRRDPRRWWREGG